MFFIIEELTFEIITHEKIMHEVRNKEISRPCRTVCDVGTMSYSLVIHVYISYIITYNLCISRISCGRPWKGASSIACLENPVDRKPGELLSVGSHRV